MTDEPSQTFAFIAMPGSFFKNIRDALKGQCPEDEIDAALFRAGKNTAEEVMANSQGRFDPSGSLEDILCDLWLENGLGRLTIKQKLGGGYEIKSEESAEALCACDSGKNSCAFTTGYLEGVVSALSSVEYSITETECVAAGKHCCKYILKKKK